jgi:hypothetical protein
MKVQVAHRSQVDLAFGNFQYQSMHLFLANAILRNGLTW